MNMQEGNFLNDNDYLPAPDEGDVLFFSTVKKKVAISSPVKVLILDLVKRGPTPLEIIVERSGKAKSTITKHIQDLEEAGLIVTHTNPDDNRRRILTISADEIGRLTSAESSIRPGIYYIPKLNSTFSGEDIAQFFRFILVTLRTKAMTIGINIDPVLKQAGIQVGEVLAPALAAETNDGVVKKIAEFWKIHHLGIVTLCSTMPLSIEVKDCFECQDLPVTGHEGCPFDKGVITAIFSYHLKCPVTVVEEECYSKGNDRCLFVIIPSSEDS
ncbi:MAG: V4R domain-containing protein [Methanomicrobiales archaeon]|jgi:predicted hydrocarbon binding protein